ncbi:DUF1957 domain-containing protein [Bacillus timonensis]|nr:DUF1957 domain-containing protein [Bacillus timonensis]
MNNPVCSILVLHAHLPYVRHYEENSMEENWLYGAMVESYLPLLILLENARVKRLQKFTISFSPPLLEMLSDPLIQNRFAQYLEGKVQLLNKEKSTRVDQRELEVINFYIERFKLIKDLFKKWNRNLIQAFKYYEKIGFIECITTSLTHAFLPYINNEKSLQIQISEAITCFTNHFGKRPLGFWLPECGINEEVDKVLSKNGIKYSFVEEQSLLSSNNKFAKSVPFISKNGIVYFQRHKPLSLRVWDANTGYPGDPDYREFYRDIGFEREWDYIKDFMHSEGSRIETGLKYYRVTGRNEKDFYVREKAVKKANKHSMDFIDRLLLEGSSMNNSHTPITLPFDAELFGHWWYEGPEWLGGVLSTLPSKVKFVTASDYLEEFQQEIRESKLTFSSWGENGYGDVWLNENTSWIYLVSHQMEHDILALSKKYAHGSVIEQKGVKQLQLEWALFISSDWAFMIHNNRTSDYAKMRLSQHKMRFELIKKKLFNQKLTISLLDKLQQDYPFSVFEQSCFYEKSQINLNQKRKHLNILMLSWEFPPNIVGGLSRHVYELSRSLASLGHHVYVITTCVEDEASFEEIDGIYVYRVKGLQPYMIDFLHWVVSLNMSIADQGYELSERLKFDIIHAHDWLVKDAATSLSKQLETPLVATIHATEIGRSRNHELKNEMQQKIYEKELQLIERANQLIVCSDYMKRELEEHYYVKDSQKIKILPNGIDVQSLEVTEKQNNWNIWFKDDVQPIVFSLGRMVSEKGFELLIQAAKKVLLSHPDTLFIIAGKGPLLNYYKSIVKRDNLEQNIKLIGHINDRLRNHLFSISSIAVVPSLYEPFGIVALEAMSAELPTIVSDTGGLNYIVKDFHTGLKFPSGNKDRLAEMILLLLNDKNLASTLAVNAKLEVSRNYQWANIAEKTSRIYKGLLKSE